MASFLERRCRTLENLESSSTSKSSVQKLNKGPNSTFRNSLIAATTTCNFCDGKDHFITSCQEFLNLTPEIRFKKAKSLGLCINCLKKGHLMKKCLSKGCRVCSLRHHSMLHMGHINQQQVSSPSSSSPEISLTLPNSSSPASSLSTCIMANAQECLLGNNVLLATAIIKVRKKYGSFIPCRAILDSAS